MTVEQWHWFSTTRMTLGVCSINGTITKSAPIVRKFIGQPVQNLRNWLQKQSGYREELIT